MTLRRRIASAVALLSANGYQVTLIHPPQPAAPRPNLPSTVEGRPPTKPIGTP